VFDLMPYEHQIERNPFEAWADELETAAGGGD
jgi:hypothetical protein